MQFREKAVNWTRATEVAVFLAIMWAWHGVAVQIAHWLFPAAN